MYIALKENVVGKVEKGEVIEVYKNTESLRDVYNGDAEKVDSEFKLKRPESSRIALLVCNEESCNITHVVGEKQIRIDPDRTVGSIESKISPDKPNAY